MMTETMMIQLRSLARSLGLPLRQIEAVVSLLDEGNTTPFIARYRRDETGGLDEETVRQVRSRLKKLRALSDRRETILHAIEAQGKLTEELTHLLENASNSRRLEDVYLPYKPKKQTPATQSRERGLGVLADEILAGTIPADQLEQRAESFVSQDLKVLTAAEALNGASQILAERYSEDSELRQILREMLQRTGRLVSMAVEPKPVAAAPTEEQTDGVEEADAVESVADSTASTGDASDDLTSAVLEAVSEQAVATDSAVVDSSATSQVVVSAVDAAPVVQSDVQAAVSEDAVHECCGQTPHDPSVSMVDATAAVGATVVKSEATSQGVVLPASEPLCEQAAVATGTDVAVSEADGVVSAAVVFSTTEDVVASEASAEAVSGVSAESSNSERGGKPAGAKAARRAAKKEKDAKKSDAEQQRKLRVYSEYFQFSEDIRRIAPHRVLAIFRGESANLLKAKVVGDNDAMVAQAEAKLVPVDHPQAEFLKNSVKEAVIRLVLPGLEREARRELAERSEAHAVEVFARNLRAFLLQPPIRGHRLLALAPGFRQGAKIVVLDKDGMPLDSGVVSLVGKGERREEARKTIAGIVSKYDITIIAIGNGAGCREAETFVEEVFHNELAESEVVCTLVNEVGSGAYSTSQEAREELPNYDASIRAAITLGRRLLDPISEYVKIEPANLGVGLYQYDVRAKHLRELLDEAVTACVSQVGVDLNRAVPANLRYIAGLNRLIARKIYDYRMANGPFTNREQVKQVPGLTEEAWIQSIGFLRIYGGDQPLDGTSVHPQQYALATQLLERAGVAPEEIGTVEAIAKWDVAIANWNFDTMATELNTGAYTIREIFESLYNPMYDIREEMPKPVFKRGTVQLDQLSPGMELVGTVLNIVDFGAFVDIGMHDSGLVHVSQLADRFVRDPQEVVSVGDVVKVWVMEVNSDHHRVSLTMIPPGASRSASNRRSGRGVSMAAPRVEDGPRDVSEERPRNGVGRRREPSRDNCGDSRGDRGGRPVRDAGRDGRGTDAARGANRGRSADGRGSSENRGEGRSERRSGRRTEAHVGTYVTKPTPAPAKPLSEEVRTGKAPMRSFADLVQFYGKKDSEETGVVEGTVTETPVVEAVPAVETVPVVDAVPERPENEESSTTGGDFTEA